MNASFVTPHCCDRPAVSNHDYLGGLRSDCEPIVNRMCLRCGTHWHGHESDVATLTRVEWDEWINDSIEVTA